MTGPAYCPTCGIVNTTARHNVEWYGVFRGTDEDPREVGWCVACEREVYDGEDANHWRTP